MPFLAQTHHSKPINSSAHSTICRLLDEKHCLDGI